MAADVDYAKQIQPLLAKHCYECHGSKKQESGLRLDSIAAMKEGGVRGEAVLPGEAEKSLLIEAVLGTDDDLLMPPEGARLSEAAIKLLSSWIDEGAMGVDKPAAPADDPRRLHWSFQPVRRTRPPQVVDGAWCRTPLDRFILARLEAAALAPAVEADRATLIRRLSLDLTGLPPSVDDVDRFLADDRPDAYERLVDRLLASPHYGERWGAALARPGPLWRLERVYDRQCPLDLEIPRLGDRCRQSRPTVRSIYNRSNRRRHARRSYPPAAHRHRLSPQHADQPGRRHRPRTVSRRGRRRSREHNGFCVSGINGWLRTMPRSQIRSDQPARVLPVVCVSEQLQRTDARSFDSPAKSPPCRIQQAGCRRRETAQTVRRRCAAKMGATGLLP